MPGTSESMRTPQPVFWIAVSIGYRKHARTRAARNHGRIPYDRGVSKPDLDLSISGSIRPGGTKQRSGLQFVVRSSDDTRSCACTWDRSTITRGTTHDTRRVRNALFPPNAMIVVCRVGEKKKKKRKERMLHRSSPIIVNVRKLTFPAWRVSRGVAA